MSCHLYCIGRTPAAPGVVIPPGVAGRAVRLLTQGGLGLAVSRVGRGDSYHSLAAIRAHEQVVAFLNRRQTVIPLRYGCRLAGEAEAARVLRERSGHYEALLAELNNGVEMGLRLLLPEEPGGSPEPEPCPAPDPGSLGEGPGLAYLKGRQAHYDRWEAWTREHQRLARELSGAFSGLFLRVKTEGPQPRLPLISLYFLVPRESVEAFGRRFRRCRRGSAARMLLTGPWPPYNFAAADPGSRWDGSRLSGSLQPSG
jgi:hypothetical protein